MVQIIECRTSDLSALRELFLKVRQETFVWTGRGSFDILDFDKETEGEFILVALWDDQIIGFISVWMQDYFIHHLFIDSHYQQKGIGTALLNAVIGKTTFPIRLKCLENNTKALGFYKRRGFIPVGTGVTEAGLYVLLEFVNSNEVHTFKSEKDISHG